MSALRHLRTCYSNRVSHALFKAGLPQRSAQCFFAQRAFHDSKHNNNVAAPRNNQQSKRGVADMGQQARVMQLAPSWKAPALVDGEIRDLSSEDYKGKFLVLLFYPADFTFVCPTEIIAFSDRIDEFKKLNAEVVGVSVDNVYSHSAWTSMPRNQGGLGPIRIPLVSDSRRDLVRKYNVLTPDRTVALRGLFVVDPKGKLRISTIHDLPIGRSVDETLRVIEAIQFTDKHGEVCPANWQKGEKTIKPDTVGSKEYFSQVNN